jgi:protein tyrosine/serine phosphatase
MTSPPKFENILNFRDVGTTINTLTSSSTLRPHLLYRSGRPDTASAADRSLLTSHYHIKSIIDLRSKTEHINVAKAHHAHLASLPPAVCTENTAPFSPPSEALPSLTIPSIAYTFISLNGPAFERYLVSLLPYLSLFKLLCCLALGYRDAAIATLSTQVMVPRGLVRLGLDTLDYSTREIKSCFDVLVDADAYPVLVHCTQGKDRTGLVILLLLLLCRVGQEAAEGDYAMSGRELEPEREERLAEIRKVGLDETFADCPPDFVRTVVNHLDEQYGGVEKYLSGIGVGEEAQQKIRAIMLNCPETEDQ